MLFHKSFLIFIYLIKNLIRCSFCLIIFTAFSLEIGFNSEHSSTTPKKIIQLNEVLENSALTAHRDPEAIAKRLDIPEYDPMLLAVLATVQSELPKRQGKWKTIQLPPSEEAKTCSQSISVILRQSPTNSPYTFIILPSPYASWKDGSSTNQLSHILDQNFNFPNILAFNGYLSPHFLRKSCESIPWNIVSISKDLHLRLRQYLNENNLSPEHTGLIGVSGGGSLAIAMLAEASGFSKKYDVKNTFELGGMSFSPFLHGRAILNNLDTRHAQSTINPNWGLSTGDLKNLWYFLNVFTLSKQEQVLYLYNKNPREFRQRVFNEFTVSYLRDTLKALRYHPSDINGEVNHYDVYINTGFFQDMNTNKLAKNVTTRKASINIPVFSSMNYTSDVTIPDSFHTVTYNRSVINNAFDQATSLQKLLPLIEQPLFIYSAKDDLIISFPNETDSLFNFSTEVLESAKNHPRIMVFNPSYGSHIGILLDPIFEELVTTFFEL